MARCCSCDEGCGGVLGPMLLFQLANWVWGEALGEGPSDAVDGEPRRAFFGGEPVGEMIEVLSRRSSLCETWRYFGAMILVDCETKEASATKESQPQSARPAKNIWPRPAGTIGFIALSSKIPKSCADGRPDSADCDGLRRDTVHQQGPAVWRDIQMLSAAFQLADNKTSGRKNSSRTRREKPVATEQEP